MLPTGAHRCGGSRALVARDGKANKAIEAMVWDLERQYSGAGIGCERGFETGEVGT